LQAPAASASSLFAAVLASSCHSGMPRLKVKYTQIGSLSQQHIFQPNRPVELGFYDASTGNLSLEYSLGHGAERGEVLSRAQLSYTAASGRQQLPGRHNWLAHPKHSQFAKADWRLVTILRPPCPTSFSPARFDCARRRYTKP